MCTLVQCVHLGSVYTEDSDMICGIFIVHIVQLYPGAAVDMNCGILTMYTGAVCILGRQKLCIVLRMRTLGQCVSWGFI